MRAPRMLSHLIYFTLLSIVFGKSLNKEDSCDESKVSFFVTDNASINSDDSLIYKDTSEEECLKTCSQNRDQYDRPIVCYSFTYDHASFSCTIYKEKAIPAGSLKIETTLGKRYFEKICLPSTTPKGCSKTQFIRVEQSVLVGYAVNMTLTDSIESCVGQCVQEADCKSAMYFYEDGECITNKESALTKPTGFTKEENDRVVYFQNGCAPDAMKVPKSTSEVHDKTTSSEKEEIAEEDISEDVVRPEVVTQISETTPKTDSEVEDSTETARTENKADQTEESEEYEDGDSGSSDLEEEKVSTTTTTTEKPTTTEDVERPARSKSLIQKKISKHPKNFGSKTYEILKNQETVKKPKQENVKSEVAVELSKSGEVEETYFSEWSDWTPCTKSQERQVRRRRCLNLRKCLGALMQVQNCPAIVQTPTAKPESVRSVVSVDGDEYDEPIAVDNISFDTLPTKSLPTLNSQVWGPWQGSCQQFASSQPCNNGNMIGFESRECIAKDPSQCEGPFFRYCTLTC